MTQRDIRMVINELYNQIDNNLRNSVFTLNKNIETLNNQIYSLREKCEHVFKDGVCIWCDLPEEMAND